VNFNFIQGSELNFEPSFHRLITGHPFCTKVEQINYVSLKMDAMKSSSSRINQLYVQDSFWVC